MLVQKMGVLVDSVSPGREHARFSLRDPVEFKLQVGHILRRLLKRYHGWSDLYRFIT